MHCSIQFICAFLVIASINAVLLHDPNLDQTIINNLEPTMEIYQKKKYFKLKKFETVQAEYAKKIQEYFETFAITNSKELHLTDVQNMPERSIYYLCHFIFKIENNFEESGRKATYISVTENGELILPAIENRAEFKKFRFSKTKLDLKPEDLAEAACKAAVELMETHFRNQGMMGVNQEVLELGLVYDSNAYKMKVKEPQQKCKYGQGLLVIKFSKGEITAEATVDSEKLQLDLPVIDKSKKGSIFPLLFGKNKFKIGKNSESSLR